MHEKLWTTLKRPSFPLSIVRQEPVVEPGPSTGSLKWHPQSETNKLPVSQPNGDFQNVTFTNQRAKAVEIVWLGPAGTQKVFQNLSPGESFRIRTRPGIVWLIREGTGESLGHFVVESMPAASAVAIIPQ